jgi:hypothetical protein
MKVNVTVIDRKSPASAQDEMEFETFAELKQKVDSFIEQLPFYKVMVEIEPLDFEPTDEQKAELTRIEEE